MLNFQAIGELALGQIDNAAVAAGITKTLDDALSLVDAIEVAEIRTVAVDDSLDSLWGDAASTGVHPVLDKLVSDSLRTLFADHLVPVVFTTTGKSVKSADKLVLADAKNFRSVQLLRNSSFGGSGSDTLALGDSPSLFSAVYLSVGDTLSLADVAPTLFSVLNLEILVDAIVLLADEDIAIGNTVIVENFDRVDYLRRYLNDVV